MELRLGGQGYGASAWWIELWGLGLVDRAMGLRLGG